MPSRVGYPAGGSMVTQLFESNRRPAVLNQSAALSFAVHALLVAGAVVASDRASDSLQSGADERSSAAYYFLPPDRVAHPPPKQERIRWVDLGLGAGSGGSELRKIDEDAMARALLVGRRRDNRNEPSQEAPAGREVLSDSVMSVIDVDSVVARYAESAAPAYPSDLLAQKIEGSVQVQYVVDTTGMVDTTSFSVIWSSHPQFATAVRDALPGMRFRAAILRSRKVRQLVQQPFVFRIVPRDTRPDQ
ncbi:MAG: energy transducer TonB [Gemmatimonadaceae bacterium]